MATAKEPTAPADGADARHALNDLLDRVASGSLGEKDALTQAKPATKEFRKLLDEYKRNWPRWRKNEVIRDLLRQQMKPRGEGSTAAERDVTSEALTELAQQNEFPKETLERWLAEFLEKRGEAERLVICNQTLRRIEIASRRPDVSGPVILAPLQQRELQCSDDYVLDGWFDCNAIDREPEKAGSSSALFVLWFYAAVGLSILVYRQGWASLEAHPAYWLTGGAAVIAIAWLSRKVSQQGTQIIGQVTSLVAVLVVGSVMCGFAYLGVGDVGERLRHQPGETVLLLVFVTIAALLPALLFFLFDRESLKALRHRFYRDILRLDPNVVTIADVEALYGQDLDDFLGPKAANGLRTLIRGTRWPIFVATVMLSLGWMLAMLPVGVEGPAHFDCCVLAMPGDLFTAFAPNRSPLVFGFLGAYLVSLVSIVRAHVRRDLRPKAYSAVVVRLFVVTILAALVEVASPDPVAAPTLWLCFAIGVFPELFFRRLEETVGSRIPGLVDEHSLTELEGIDLYDRARLADEGITNIESLAHCDLPQLLLRTRFSARRLVDWVDQAILYLHATRPRAGVDTPAETSTEHKPEEEAGTPTGGATPPAQSGHRSLLTQLREHGIRTASDLRRVHNAAQPEGHPFRQFGSSASRLCTIMNALADDEWLFSVERWRSNERPGVQIVRRPEELFASNSMVEE